MEEGCSVVRGVNLNVSPAPLLLNISDCRPGPMHGSNSDRPASHSQKDRVEVRRSYSISSLPLALPKLSVTIKRVAGGVASPWLLDTLQLGSTVHGLAPQGDFLLRGAAACKPLGRSSEPGVMPPSGTPRDRCMGWRGPRSSPGQEVDVPQGKLHHADV